MRADQNYYDRVIRSGGEVVRIRCRPMGSALRDVTDPSEIRWIQWFTIIPGVLGLIALVLHLVKYRGKWEIMGDPVGLSHGPTMRLQGLRKREALVTFEDPLAWLDEGNLWRDLPRLAGESVGGP